MFGSKPATGGLFGQSSSNQQGTGLFGAKPVSNTGTTGGGLFGNTQNTTGTPQFGQATQPGTSSNTFSQGNTAAQSQPQQPSFGGSGLFGNNNNANNNNTNSSTSNTLFGSAPKPTTSLFGNTQQPAQSAPAAAPPMFGQKPAFGQAFCQSQQQQPQQQQLQPQQPIITPFTRPSDLPEAVQKELENTDNYIRQQVQLSEDLSHVIPEQETLITSVPRDVQLLRFKLTSAKETLKFDDGQLAKLKRLVDTDATDAELLAEVTNQPRKYDRLMPYFRQIIDRESQIDQLALAMRDVQQAVTAEEFGKRVTYDDQGLQALPDALKEEYVYFMSLSDRVAELHRHIEERQDGETEEMQMY